MSKAGGGSPGGVASLTQAGPMPRKVQGSDSRAGHRPLA